LGKFCGGDKSRKRKVEALSLKPSLRTDKYERKASLAEETQIIWLNN
jgi:hypothetical protein